MVSTLLVFGQLALTPIYVEQAKASLQPTLSAWAETTPLIDGNLRAVGWMAEWSDADKIDFDLTWGAESHNASLYVKNDYINLYLAFVIENEDFDVNDRVVFNFDNDDNGEKSIGDDQLWVDMAISFVSWEHHSGHFTDGFFPTPSDGPSWFDDVTSGGKQDGVGAAQFSSESPSEPGNYVVEVAHPLNTIDDSHDFSLGVGATGVGDTVGINVIFLDSGVEGTGWPTYTWGNWSQMATIVLADHDEPLRHLRRNLTIYGIEITQAVQYFHDFGHEDNSLPLAYGKSTVVRVYIDLGFLVEASVVTVYLYATTSSGDSLAWPQGRSTYGPLRETVEIPGFLPPFLHRDNENFTANFLLPDYWVMRGSLKLVAFVKASEGLSELSYADNWMEWQTHSFTLTKPIEIGYYLIDYRPTAPNADPNIPANDKILNGKIFFEKVTPMPDLSDPVLYYPLGPPLFWDRSNFTKPSTNPRGWDDNGTAQRLLLLELQEIYEDLLMRGAAPDQLVGLYTNAITSTGRVWSIPGNVFIAHEIRPWSFAHEIGHNYGFPHSWSDGANPFFGELNVNSSQTYGFDTLENWLPFEPGDVVKIPASDDSENKTKYGALMSYYNTRRWISPYEWEGLVAEFDPPFEMLQTSTSTTIQSSSPGLRITGEIFKNSTGKLFPVFQTPSFLNTTQPGGPYAVELRGAPPGEPLLYLQTFNVSFEPDAESEFFILNLPSTTGVYSVSIWNISISPPILLDKITASANPPQVTITYPNNGEAVEDSFNATWTAFDTDSDPLTFKLFYSVNGGETWQPLSPRITSTSYQVDTSYLSGGPQTLIRVLASDGFHTSEDQCDTFFSIPLKEPMMVAGIGIGPCNTYIFGEPIVFKGSAFDPEDGMLQDPSLTWTSDLDGFLGTGKILSVDSLTPGIHNITLTATDSHGNNATDSFNATVLIKNLRIGEVSVSKTPIKQGALLEVNITILNDNEHLQSSELSRLWFEIRGLGSTDPVLDGNVTVTILPYEPSALVTLNLTTTFWPPDNYSIAVYIAPLRGEHFTFDNFRVNSLVEVVYFPWDVTGDNYVGIDDIVAVAENFGTDPTHPNWNHIYDINDDNYIGIDDIVSVAEHFGETI